MENNYMPYENTGTEPLLIRALKNPKKVLKTIRGIVWYRFNQISIVFTRIRIRRPKVFQKKIDLVILDAIFPHPLSPFRTEEFCSYLKYFKNSIVLSTGTDFQFIKETRTLKTVIKDFESRCPDLKGRTRITNSNIDKYNIRLAYLTFFNNIKAYLKTLEDKKIPFIFTLYPEGGFELNKEQTDNDLRRIFRSPMFRVFCK